MTCRKCKTGLLEFDEWAGELVCINCGHRLKRNGEEFERRASVKYRDYREAHIIKPKPILSDLVIR